MRDLHEIGRLISEGKNYANQLNTEVIDVDATIAQYIINRGYDFISNEMKLKIELTTLRALCDLKNKHYESAEQQLDQLRILINELNTK